MEDGKMDAGTGGRMGLGRVGNGSGRMQPYRAPQVISHSSEPLNLNPLNPLNPLKMEDSRIPLQSQFYSRYLTRLSGQSRADTYPSL
jgi:hypothetical protein